jgi:streptogramin lyase
VGQFNSLTGICVDDQNKIYVADGTNNRIVRINSITGAGWVAFGSTGTGFNQFNIAFGVGVDRSGKIYIGDRNNHRLVRIDDMTGANWTELDNLPSGSFGTVTSVFPHLPGF